MKNIRTKILILSSVFLSLASCSDDFLDEENPNFLNEKLAYRTNDDLESGLTAVYSSLRKEEAIATLMEYERSDMTFPGFRNFTPGSKPFYEQVFANNTLAVDRKWSHLYEGVFRANQVIEGYERILPSYEGQDSGVGIVGNVLYAEARALRGYLYFQLANSFNGGSIPLFKNAPSHPDDYQQPLAHKDSIVKFYREDLAYGRDYLPSNWAQGTYTIPALGAEVTIPTDSQLGRITAGACEALLGKSFLYEYDYEAKASGKSQEALDNAIASFNNVVNNYGYALTPHVGDNFTSQSEFNSESIFEINYTISLATDDINEEALHNGVSLDLGLQQQAPRNVPASWLVVEYKKDSIDKLDPMNTVVNPDYDPDNIDPVNPLSPTEFRTYSERTSHSVSIADDRNVSFYNGNRPPEVSSYGNAHTSPHRAFYWKKLTNWDVASSELALTTDGRSGVNMRIIRLADVYLMLAECLLEKGNLDQARYYINKVRRRSRVVLLGPSTGSEEFSAYTFTTDSPNIDRNLDGDTDDFNENNSYDTYERLTEHLRHVERPLELAMEGNAIRTIDLRRWGITKERFEDLAARRYVSSALATNANGTHRVKWNAQLFEDVLDDSGNSLVGPFQIILDGEVVNIPNGQGTPTQHNDFRDLQAASINYNEDQHAYLPLPLSEVNSNKLINNN